MNNIGLKSVAIYAFFTAIALLLLVAFARFINDNDTYVVTGLLIFGATGAAAVAIYAAMRWYWAHYRKEILSKPLEEIFRKLGEMLRDGGDRAVTFADLWDMRNQVRPLADLAARLTKSILTMIMIIGLALSLMAIAAAAVAYLQVKRLEEQNALLDQQNRVQTVAFLNESVSSIEAIQREVEKSRESQRFLTDDMLSPFEILDEFMAVSETGEQIAAVENRQAEVCDRPADETCSGIDSDQLFQIGIEGSLSLNEDNIEAARGYARLADVAEQMFFAFATSVEGTTDDSGGVNTFISDKLNEIQLTCGASRSSDLSDLWLGIGGLGGASIDMFEQSPAELETGDRIDVTAIEDRANFGAFASALGIIRQALGETVDQPLQTPQDAADLLARGLLALERDLKGLVEICNTSAESLSKTALIIQDERIHQTAQMERLQQQRLADGPESVAAVD